MIEATPRVAVIEGEASEHDGCTLRVTIIGEEVPCHGCASEAVFIIKGATNGGGKEVGFEIIVGWIGCPCGLGGGESMICSLFGLDQIASSGSELSPVQSEHITSQTQLEFGCLRCTKRATELTHWPCLGDRLGGTRVKSLAQTVVEARLASHECPFVNPDPLQLRPLIMPVIDDTDCPYYPGQRVRAISSSVFEGSSCKAKLLKGTVVKVQTDSVVVYWIASAVHGVGDNSATFPSTEQNPKNLTLLSCSSHTNWQLADWCLLPSYPRTNDLPKNCSCSTSYSVAKKPANGIWPAYHMKPWKYFYRRDKKIWRRDGNFERALLIVKAFNKVDVAWQDGTTEFGLRSTSLIPFDTPNDHEFFPGEYVVEKAQNEGGSSSEINQLGVLRSANSQEQTVCVRWLKPVSRPGDLREFSGEEVVSAYELERHADYDYFYGDVVVRLPPVSDGVSTETQGNQLGTQGTADDSSKEYVDNIEENQAQDNEACEDFTSLSWVGKIVGLQDGEKSATILEKESSGGQSRPLTLPLAAIDYAVKHTTELFSQAKKQLESSGLDKKKGNDANHKADLDCSGSKLDGEDENEGFDVSDGLIAERIHEIIETETHVEATEKAEVKIEVNLEKPASMGLNDGSEGSCSMDDPCKFKHFDTAENPLDHHFLGDAEMGLVLNDKPYFNEAGYEKHIGTVEAQHGSVRVHRIVRVELENLGRLGWDVQLHSTVAPRVQKLTGPAPIEAHKKALVRVVSRDTKKVKRVPSISSRERESHFVGYSEGIYTCGAEKGCTKIFNGHDTFGWPVGTALRGSLPSSVLGSSFGETIDCQYDPLSMRRCVKGHLRLPR
ncbi:hypothetical protein GW17_00040003 [Ensete ventricosum]|nr:hypothetical protein GW17_00040003 [Ensete ventricosum]